MKKMLSMVLMAALMLSFSAFALEAEKPEEKAGSSPVVMYGSIVKIENGTIEVKEHRSEKSIVLSVSKNTYLLDAVSGEPLAKELKVGEAVAAYYGPLVKESLPLQSDAVAVIGNIPQDMGFPLYATVEKVETTEKGIQITCNNHSVVVSLPSDISITTSIGKEKVNKEDIVVGSRLVVWHGVMATSMPGQTTATRATLLNPKNKVEKSNMVVSFKAGTVTIDGKEVPLNGGELYKKDGKIMLPLRALAEALGHEVVWMPLEDGVEIKMGDRSVLIHDGKTDYRINNVTFALDMAPEQTKDRTYVYLDFFEKVLGVSVVTK